MELDINKLNIQDLEELLEKVMNILEIKNNSSSSHHSIIADHKEMVYPHCGFLHILKNGKTKEGSQKYICKDCHKSLSSTTNTFLFSSNKGYEKWKNFIRCEFLNLTLIETAEEVGISQTTAFFWRHKLYNAIEKYVDLTRLDGEIELDATYIPVCLKGTKKDKMPRRSKKRSNDGMRSGQSHQQMCIISAIDENDNAVLKLTNVGVEEISSYEKVFKFFDKPKVLVGDGFNGYKGLETKFNIPIIKIEAKKHVNELGYSLAKTNQFHRDLKTRLKRYNGVSTRHINGYLSMYVLIRKMNYMYQLNKDKCVNTYNSIINSEVHLINKSICSIPYIIDMSRAYEYYERK